MKRKFLWKQTTSSYKLNKRTFQQESFWEENAQLIPYNCFFEFFLVLEDLHQVARDEKEFGLFVAVHVLVADYPSKV
jgi:hypothetical protein